MRVPIGLALKTSSATAGQDPGKQRGRKIVIALQISLCLTLLMGSGLLVRSLNNLRSINLGMRTSGLLVFGVSPQAAGAIGWRGHSLLRHAGEPSARHGGCRVGHLDAEPDRDGLE